VGGPLGADYSDLHRAELHGVPSPSFIFAFYLECTHATHRRDTDTQSPAKATAGACHATRTSHDPRRADTLRHGRTAIYTISPGQATCVTETVAHASVRYTAGEPDESTEAAAGCSTARWQVPSALPPSDRGEGLTRITCDVGDTSSARWDCRVPRARRWRHDNPSRRPTAAQLAPNSWSHCSCPSVGTKLLEPLLVPREVPSAHRGVNPLERLGEVVHRDG
jgi:hypothetical protein